MSKSKPRKRDRTRERLLLATQELLLERPVSTISFKDVAERADVVNATIYNYYQTREELIKAVGLLIHMTYTRVIDAVTAPLQDAADIFAASVTQTMLYAANEPTYGKLLFDAGLPLDRFLLGMRMRFQADLQRGVKQGRFNTDNPELIISMVSGGTLGVAMDLYRKTLPPKVIPDLVAYNLRALGMRRADATKVANKKFDLLPTEPLPASWLALLDDGTEEDE